MADLNSLAKAIKDGDEASIGTLYEATYSGCVATAQKYMGNREDAEDMVQEAFIKVISHVDRFDETQEFGAWQYTILVNTCKNELARKHHRAVKPFSAMERESEEGERLSFTEEQMTTDSSTIPEEALDMKSLRSIVEEMLDELPDEQRQAMVLFHYCDMPLRKIAEQQGCGEDTVKSRLNYGRQKVRTAVELFEKKNGLRLHSISVAPLLYLIYKAEGVKAAALAGAAAGTGAAAGAVAENAGVATTTAATATTAATTATTTATTTTAAATTVATTTTAVAAKATLGIGAKIAIGAAAATLGIGAGAATGVVTTPIQEPPHIASKVDAAVSYADTPDSTDTQTVTPVPPVVEEPEDVNGFLYTTAPAGDTSDEKFREKPDATIAVFAAYGNADCMSFTLNGVSFRIGESTYNDFTALLGAADFDKESSEDTCQTESYYLFYDDTDIETAQKNRILKLEFCDLQGGALAIGDRVLYRITVEDLGSAEEAYGIDFVEFAFDFADGEASLHNNTAKSVAEAHFVTFLSDETTLSAFDAENDVYSVNVTFAEEAEDSVPVIVEAGFDLGKVEY